MLPAASSKTNKTVKVKRKKKKKKSDDRQEYTLKKTMVCKKMRIATKIGSVNMALTPEKMSPGT